MFTAALVSGLGLGSMYGLMAMGFHLTYAVSGTVNFAQGSSMMLGAVLTFALAQTLGWPMPVAIVLALAGCAAYGLVVEAIAVRPFVRRGSDSWLMSTLLDGVAGVLIAPLFNVHSEMGTLFGIKAFAVAILGGIGNAWGVMLAGLIFGALEAAITVTLGSGYTQIITFALVIVALALR